MCVCVHVELYYDEYMQVCKTAIRSGIREIKSMSETIEIKIKFALACHISFDSITFEDLGKTFSNQFQE